MKRRKKHFSECGSTTLEAVMALTVLFFILFAMLQICRWCRQRQFCQYAAYYAGKGLALGYRLNFALRAARVAAIPICGKSTGAFSGDAPSAAAAYMIDGDASGVRYEYWHGDGTHAWNDGDRAPSLLFYYQNFDESSHAVIKLDNAPLFEETGLKKMFSIETKPNPSAQVSSFNYSQIYMED